MKVLGKNVAVRVTKSSNNINISPGGLYVASVGDEGTILKGTVELVGIDARDYVGPADVVHFSKFNSSKVTNLSNSQMEGDMYIVGMEYILLVE